MFFASLVATNTLRDGAAFFDSTVHVNVVGAGTLDATRLASAISLLRSQRSAAGKVLNLPPRFLVVPPASEANALALVRNVETANGSPLEVVADGHLTGTTFYLAADPKLLAGFALGFLRDIGAALPTVVAKHDFATEGVAFKFRHDAAVGPNNYRAWVRGPGA